MPAAENLGLIRRLWRLAIEAALTHSELMELRRAIEAAERA